MNLKNWNDFDTIKPPINTLIIVTLDMGGIGFRRQHTNGDWYDENEVLDDSNLKMYQWVEIP